MPAIDLKFGIGEYRKRTVEFFTNQPLQRVNAVKSK
jgi:hypothetical protein